MRILYIIYWYLRAILIFLGKITPVLGSDGSLDFYLFDDEL